MTQGELTISGDVARRYLLGRQGLWPGRRWAGKDGVAEAILALESVQVDPMSVVARSHDLVLWSRVEDYEPAQLDELRTRARSRTRPRRVHRRGRHATAHRRRTSGVSQFWLTG